MRLGEFNLEKDHTFSRAQRFYFTYQRDLRGQVHGTQVNLIKSPTLGAEISNENIAVAFSFSPSSLRTLRILGPGQVHRFGSRGSVQLSPCRSLWAPVKMGAPNWECSAAIGNLESTE